VTRPADRQRGSPLVTTGVPEIHSGSTHVKYRR
jgi:hypothetical protein